MDNRNNELIEKLNSYNRLILTAADFKRLNKYALTARKARKCYIEEGESNSSIALEEKADFLYEDFLKNFYNPFELDFEFDTGAKHIYFDFWDYDYLYRVFKCKGGWEVVFYSSFYNEPSREDVPLGFGYKYDSQIDAVYLVSYFDRFCFIDSEPFVLEFQKWC